MLSVCAHNCVRLFMSWCISLGIPKDIPAMAFNNPFSELFVIRVMVCVCVELGVAYFIVTNKIVSNHKYSNSVETRNCSTATCSHSGWWHYDCAHIFFARLHSDSCPTFIQYVWHVRTTTTTRAPLSDKWTLRVWHLLLHTLVTSQLDSRIFMYGAGKDAITLADLSAHTQTHVLTMFNITPSACGVVEQWQRRQRRRRRRELCAFTNLTRICTTMRTIITSEQLLPWSTTQTHIYKEKNAHVCICLAPPATQPLRCYYSTQISIDE